MHALTHEDAERLDTLARYLAHGIEQKAAGAAVGYSAGRVNQLLTDEAFQERVAAHQKEILTTYVDVNTMYDTIERKALANLLDHARMSKDPDLNLRLAMMANRATRRGVLAAGNRPLDAGRGDGYVHIDLSFNLVQRVREKDLHAVAEIDGESRDVDIASPGMVEHILADIPNDSGMPSVKAAMPDGPDPVGLARFFTPIDG